LLVLLCLVSTACLPANKEAASFKEYLTQFFCQILPLSLQCLTLPCNNFFIVPTLSWNGSPQVCHLQCYVWRGFYIFCERLLLHHVRIKRMFLFFHINPSPLVFRKFCVFVSSCFLVNAIFAVFCGHGLARSA